MAKASSQKTSMASADLNAIYQALDRIQAIIEFNLDGTIVKANDNFLKTMGYEADEIIGQHHRIFCQEEYAQSEEYQELWDRLNNGEPLEAEYKRVAKDGSEVWLQASYNPVLGSSGKPVRVVKFATDITEAKLKDAQAEGMIEAINRVQAVIEFDLDGTILNANQNFMDTFNYSLDEIQGKHHRMFCEKSYTQSEAYADFWKRLGDGEFESGEFKRIAKDGSEVWLQASYNPIFDSNGKLLKIIKFASDITAEVNRRSLALLEMATPVTKIWDGVLFAPIVGIIDSKRAVDIMNKSLSSIAETQARTLVLDISGVAMVDTAVANHLIKITKAAVLMGCKAIISGISPAIAQTITELGIDLSSIHTTSTIESALREFISQPDTGPKLI